jgi:photosystem II stability/assembly factor-like uncharacterized protein
MLNLFPVGTENRISVPIALILLVAALPSWGATWKVQLNYDKDASSLELHDLQCPSPKVCVAAGAIVDTAGNKDKVKGTVVFSSDGGSHWAFEDIPEVPESLFILNDSTGWIVTDKGIWQSVAVGRDWKKISVKTGVERVWFLDQSHGFAIGVPKAIYETHDGGKAWTQIPASNLPDSPTATTSYDSIFFAGPMGLISGMIAPENLNLSRSPLGAVLLASSDAGQTWESKPIRLNGRISCLRSLNEKSRVLAVVEYFGKSKFPTELFALDLDTLKTQPVFRQTDRVARDAIVLPDGQVLVAAVERMGELSEVPIPSKLKMMQSMDLETWLPESSDYRAVAMRPILAAADAHNIWVATDTGMILKRVE